MAINKITIQDLLELRDQVMVFDVRSPGEYEHAHIPTAVSFPLFTNEERKVVGTTYKRESREQAIKIGLDYFGVKMRSMVEQAEQLLKEKDDKKVIVHCWRGGMRSAAVAWLLDLYGFEVYLLVGGYKAYRRWANQLFKKSYPFNVLSGYTGGGKTRVLRELNKQGVAALDLEGLAKHRGSSFGGIRGVPQPTQEMFENNLAEDLHRFTDEERIWVEDESRRIGDLNIPPPLWGTLREAPLYLLDVPFEERLTHIVEEYGEVNKEDLISATKRIQKRLGGLATKNSIAFIEEGNITEAFRILLQYYDKQYQKALDKRGLSESAINRIETDTVDEKVNTNLLLKWKRTKTQ